MSTLLHDFRYGFRMLRKNPVFTVVAVASLALGIGANTAVFQLIDAVRLRTLPVEDPQRLVVLDMADWTGKRGNTATEYPALTNPLWERFRDTQDVFSGVLAWSNNGFNLARGGETRSARGLFVSGDFFRVLGVNPLYGRVFTATDDRRGCGVPGAVVSYSFWQRELGGDPAAVGRKITLNYHDVDVIGVTPAGFSGLEVGRAFDVAVPICSQEALWSEGNWLNAGAVWWLTVHGRLKPGATLEQANARLATLSPGLFQSTLPGNYPAANVKDYLRFRLKADPAGGGVSGLRDEYGSPLLLLLATTGLVLLIACANLANLMLARATARGHEIAIRLSLGASRGRLVRQLMAESLLLAAAGATLGLFLSGALSDFLVALLGSQGNSLFLDLESNRRVLAFTIALATLTCVLFGLAPAFRATRVAPGEAMKSNSRSIAGKRERFGLRQSLVVSQVALSMILLVSALLFSGTLRNLLSVDAGFRQSGILVTNLDYSRLKVPVARRAVFKSELLDRFRALPGVDSAAQVSVMPLSGSGMSNKIWLDGKDPDRQPESYLNWISQGYLKTMGLELLAGRDFDGHETAASPKVAIVNQSFARMLGIEKNPIGKRIRKEATPYEKEVLLEIVGLVKDTKYYSLREGFLPIAFLSIDQETEPNPFAQIVVRSAMPLADLTARIRKTVATVGAEIDIDFGAFETTVREGLLRERLMATLSGFFGLLAALIAAIGLYGVMTYLIVRRTNEIGIRMALGADRRNILVLIVREATVLVAIGLAIGSVLSMMAARAAGSMLFGLKPNDPAALAVAAGALAAVTIAASSLAARRAARLEPLVALRND